MKKGSFLSDMLQISLPVAIAAIDAAITNKRKSKENDIALMLLRDNLIARYPLKKK